MTHPPSCQLAHVRLGGDKISPTMAKKKSKKVTVVIRPKKAKQKKDNVTRLGGALRVLGGLGGRALGTLVGFGDDGAKTGTSLGGALSRWLGAGDYTVRSNSLVSMAKSGSIPSMHRNSQSVVVRHKEFLGDVSAGTGTPTSFNMSSAYPLNPGMSRTFPWLSQIAAQYQEYTFRGIVFHFVSTSGESVASTNTSLGTVMMTTNYKATDSAPQSKVELLNEFFSCDAKPSESFCHPIECDPKENPYKVQYVRTGSIPSSEDLKTYDLGEFYIGTQGIPAASTNLGELWVSYEVELRKPKLSGFGNLDLPTASFTATSNINTTTPFGTNRTTVYDNIGLTVSNNGTISFPPGKGPFVMILIYTGVTNTADFATTRTNLANPAVFNGARFSRNVYSAITATAAASYVMDTIDLTDDTLPATWAGSWATLTGATAFQLLVLPISAVAY